MTSKYLPTLAFLIMPFMTPLVAQDNFEYGVDRRGGDYRSFDLPQDNPQICAAQCGQDGRCRAWAYVKPGVQARAARCWLKDQVPNGLPGNPAVISGVTRPAAPAAALVFQGVQLTDIYDKQKRSVRVDNIHSDSRGGVVDVTALDDGTCAPMRGTPGPATIQHFRYTWTFDRDVSSLGPGQAVLVTFQLDGDRQPCLNQNPYMFVMVDQEHFDAPAVQRGARFYFDSSAAGPNHLGGQRRIAVSDHWRPTGHFEIHLTGFTGMRGMDLNFSYNYTAPKAR